jgi:hypothetical protein
MTRHYRWDTTLEERRRNDPGIDDPARRTAAREARTARDVTRKQRGRKVVSTIRPGGASLL